MAEPAPRPTASTERRPLVVGGVVALLVAAAAGSVFWVLSFRPTSDADEVGVQRTERAVATLPQPEAAPAPVADHFPPIDGLEAAEADDALVAGLEQRLRPAGGDFAATRHRQLRDGADAVAVVSLLRAADDEAGAGLRQAALDGFGELFDEVGDGEVADEAVVRARSRDGTALLWVPDPVTVMVVSAVSDARAEAVLSEVVDAVRGDGAGDDALTGRR